jgi:hypothetical protein
MGRRHVFWTPPSPSGGGKIPNYVDRVIKWGIRSAIAEVNALPRVAFGQPNLAGVLERIASKLKFDVATIDKSGMKATAQTLKREIRDYGDRRGERLEVRK